MNKTFEELKNKTLSEISVKYDELINIMNNYIDEVSELEEEPTDEMIFSVFEGFMTIAKDKLESLGCTNFNEEECVEYAVKVVGAEFPEPELES